MRETEWVLEECRQLDEFHGLQGDAILNVMEYDMYLLTNHWSYVRSVILSSRGYRCQLCGTDKGDMHVHHNTYERLGNEEGLDLIILCAGCHARHHGKQPDHHAHTGIVCPGCGEEYVVEVRVVKLEGRE